MSPETIEVIGEWMSGEISDEMIAELLTDRDLRTLQKRVMKAITAKLLENPESIVFAEHKTLQ
jgi:hypothetical protein